MNDDRSLRLYGALALLPRMSHFTLESEIPADGIYFFFESGESALVGGTPTNRIVRIGINTSDSLPGRLHKHFSETGVSIFKWHVCCALLARDDPGHWALHAERPYLIPELRDMVCRRMRQMFSYVCVHVPHRDDRLRLEKGLIALLAQYPVGAPSPNWLGHYAVKPYRKGQPALVSPEPNRYIRASGLWNVHHINGVPISQSDIVLLEQLARAT